MIIFVFVLKDETENIVKLCHLSTQTEAIIEPDCSIKLKNRCHSRATQISHKSWNKKTQTTSPHEIGIFHVSIQKNGKKCKFYTGLQYSQIIALYEFCSPECESLSLWSSIQKPMQKNKKKQPSKLTSLEQLLIVLVRLRVGLLTEDMSYRFHLSTGLISKIVSTWVRFLHHQLTMHLKWRMFPSRQVIAQTLPKVFKDLKNIRALLDCTEFFCQSPSNFEHQGNLYSSYKAHTTFKVLIACAPQGSISFVSDAYEGSISDREIVIQSKFVDLLDPGDLIIADRGFTIHDIVESKQAFLNIPPFLNGRDRLTAQEEIETKLIAKQRIYIEHAIGRLKQFRLLQRVLPLKMRNIMSEIIFVCACLVNFQPPIVFDS